MNLSFVNRLIRTSLILALVLFPFLAVYISIGFAVAYVFGCVWACVNLFAIKLLVTSTVSPNPRSKFVIAFILFFKFPVIYFLGYLLIIWKFTPVSGLLWGFSSTLIVAVLKAVSRSMLHLDSKPEVNAS